VHVATATNRVINVASSDSDDDIVASSSGTSEQDFTPEHFYTAVILHVANQHANQISYAYSRVILPWQIPTHVNVINMGGTPNT